MMKKVPKSGRSGGHDSHRNHAYFIWTYGVSAMVWIAVLLAGGLFHFIWGDDPVARALFGAFAAAFSVGYPLYLWKITKPRGQVLQWIATISGAAAGVWLTLAGMFSPFSGPLLSLWFGVGLGFLVFWWSRRAVMQGARDDQEGQHAITGKEAQLVEAFNGATVLKVESKAGEPIRARVELNRGNQSAKEFQDSAVPAIEQILKTRPGAVRAIPDRKDSGQVELTLVPGDPLEGTVYWPGPSNPGGSIHDPIAVGVYEDGSDCVIWFTGDDALGRALAHWLIMGVTRAGKSQALVQAIADALTRRDVVAWGSDHVKGKQTFRPVLEALDWVCDTRKQANKMLNAARQIVAYRANYLGERGYTQWTPKCGLPLLIVWIEEAVEIVVESTAFVRLVQQAGSTGVVLIASLQRASHTSIDTDARAQLTGAWCFGVQKSQDAHFILPDEVIDAGAHPESWGNRKPGYSYLVAPGIPEEKWAMPLRTFRTVEERDPNTEEIVVDQVRDVLREWAHVRCSLDEGSALAAGEEYRLRHTAAADSLPDTAHGNTGSRMAFTSGDDDYDEDGDEQMTPEQTRAYVMAGTDADDYSDEERMDPHSEATAPLPPDPDPDIKVDPNEPIPPYDGPPQSWGVSTTRPELSTEEARAVVQQHLAALLRKGITTTQPADIHKMKPDTGNTREWVRLELLRLADPDKTSPDEITLSREDNTRSGVYDIHLPVAGRELAAANR